MSTAENNNLVVATLNSVCDTLGLDFDGKTIDYTMIGEAMRCTRPKSRGEGTVNRCPGEGTVARWLRLFAIQSHMPDQYSGALEKMRETKRGVDGISGINANLAHLGHDSLVVDLGGRQCDRRVESLDKFDLSDLLGGDSDD